MAKKSSGSSKLESYPQYYINPTSKHMYVVNSSGEKNSLGLSAYKTCDKDGNLK